MRRTVLGKEAAVTASRISGTQWGDLKLDPSKPIVVEEKRPRVHKLQITGPNLQRGVFPIIGDVLVMAKPGRTCFLRMRDTQTMDSQARKNATSKKNRAPKDFDLMFQESIRQSPEGWYGFPAPGLRKALIDACRLVDFKMTLAKCSIFVDADGFDKDDRMPLVRMKCDPPEKFESFVRNADGGTDIRARAMFKPGWTANVRLKWDADQFRAEDVANLLARVGAQIGLMDGRNFSPNSAGMGWGCFELIKEESADGDSNGNGDTSKA